MQYRHDRNSHWLAMDDLRLLQDLHGVCPTTGGPGATGEEAGCLEFYPTHNKNETYDVLDSRRRVFPDESWMCFEV